MHEPKRIAILGSTGSIGQQTLDVIATHPDQFSVEVLTAQNNYEKLIQQAKKWKPGTVVITNKNFYKKVQQELASYPIEVHTGQDALAEVPHIDTVDMVVVALVGFGGLSPTLSAIHAHKNIALANKETLVVAGEYITDLARKKGVNIIPIDSEHSALFQCLMGESYSSIEKIILTASGGPFLGMQQDQLTHIKKEDALKHPTWSMGSKITIDSATLMNKGLEVIEAHWLFGIHQQQIEVVIHPQSIIHSMVQLKDGSIKAQMSLPDMKIPIQFALTYPDRLSSNFTRFDFTNYPNLTFMQPDLITFRNLALAYEALNCGGNIPCVLNAANEIAVDAFLHDQIGFLEIANVIEKCMNTVSFDPSPGYSEYVMTDKETRIKASQYIKYINPWKE